MALFTCVYLLLSGVLFYVIIVVGNRYPDVVFIKWGTVAAIIAWVMFYGFMMHYFNVLSQPIKTEKATVIATISYGRSSSTIKYYGLKFKAEVGNEFAVRVPYEVYKALEKGDKVLVKHQGTELINIKKIIYKSNK